MTKDVLITVKGLQIMEDEGTEPLELVTAGEYYYRNGHHYLRYDEVYEEISGNTINYIKADDKSMEVRKKGVTNVHMVFEEAKKNVTYYQTPFGNIQMGISAAKVTCKEGENTIDIHVNYALEMNDEHVADCFIDVGVRPRQGEDLHL